MRSPDRAPVLEGEDVRLRPHRPEDVGELLAHLHDPRTQLWTDAPGRVGTEDVCAWVAGRERDLANAVRLDLAVESGRRCAGTVSLVADGARAAYLEYGIAPWARGRGLGVAALRVLLPWAFAELDLDQVLWRAVAGNWPARRVAWHLGVRIEGTVRGLLELHGTRVDAWVGSLLATDPVYPRSPWPAPPRLGTPEVTLRPHRAADLPDIVEACNDAASRQWLPDLPAPYDHDDARAHLEAVAENRAAGRAVHWVVTGSDGDRLAGEIGVWEQQRGRVRGGEIGYWTHPRYRGQGLARTAVGLVARYALLPEDVGGFGFDRLVIRVAEDNLPSQRVALAAGFRPVGRETCSERLRDGRLTDMLRFDLVEPPPGPPER